MPSYYEINVTLNGRHFFATAPRSFTTITELEWAYTIFEKKFTKDEGYGLSVTHWQSYGKKVEGFPF